MSKRLCWSRYLPTSLWQEAYITVPILCWCVAGCFSSLPAYVFTHIHTHCVAMFGCILDMYGCIVQVYLHALSGVCVCVCVYALWYVAIKLSVFCRWLIMNGGLLNQKYLIMRIGGLLCARLYMHYMYYC